MNLQVVSSFCLVILSLALVLVLYRVVRGPTVADRIAALDLAAVIAASFIGVICIRTDNAAYLDVAVVLAILTFLGTVAFSRYLERRALK